MVEAALAALTTEVRKLVSALETAERKKDIEKITQRRSEKDLVTEEWEESKPIIQSNFESWRDYLYKYALILISVLGFITSLIATKWVGQLNIALVVFGIICLGISIFITFISIFVTLYLERKFVAANMAFTQCMQVNFHKADGLDDGKRNPMRAIEKYLEGVIVTRETELRNLKNKQNDSSLTPLQLEQLEWEITDLSMGIRGDKRSKDLMKYVGVQYTSYETARLVITIFVVTLSLVGLSAIIFALLFAYSTHELNFMKDFQFHVFSEPSDLSLNN